MSRKVANPLWALVATAVLLGGCGEGGAAPGLESDTSRGRVAIRQHGCDACHNIPGIAGANGRVGPPLEGIARRAYLGGVLPNTPENMVRWLLDPTTIDPRTAMPNLALSPGDARDITAYLYTLR